MKKLILPLLILASCKTEQERTVERLYKDLATQKAKTDSLVNDAKALRRLTDTFDSYSLYTVNKFHDSVFTTIRVLSLHAELSQKRANEITDSIMLLK